MYNSNLSGLTKASNSVIERFSLYHYWGSLVIRSYMLKSDDHRLTLTTRREVGWYFLVCCDILITTCGAEWII